jgi:glycerate-2-kinase
VKAAEEIVNLAKGITEKDLVIVAVSGGGSALLCYPESECTEGAELYEDFLKAGGTITDINLVRKHLSELKGGGLIKLLYPATIIGLVFSDIPGGELSDVASGPTYFDPSTEGDARAMLDKYRLPGNFSLIETPKDKKFFEKTKNFCLVSNRLALEAVALGARQAGYEAKIVSEKLYGFPAQTLDEFFGSNKAKTVLVGGGEARLVIEGHQGTGGRNLYLANDALTLINGDNELFVSLASDGIDNCEAAGAFADSTTLRHAKEKNLSIDEHLKSYDCETLFKETGDAIYTGQTGSNVSDIMMYIRE